MLFSINDFGPIINIQLPKEKFTGFKLYEVMEVSCNPNKDISFEGVKYDQIHPWVDIPAKNLNTEIGLHIYKVSFFNDTESGSVFFGYEIQNSNPEKPYIYMTRDNNE